MTGWTKHQEWKKSLSRHAGDDDTNENRGRIAAAVLAQE
jgi:hypothetical protein